MNTYRKVKAESYQKDSAVLLLELASERSEASPNLDKVDAIRFVLRMRGVKV